ncbi:LysR substrate-binding domain-containing protein, partial [Staphylococcus epidermidis]|uniref:LysR substrate-binding domain-containing protein n=1 Tax=Staphylococcus epidermidis TaxID=1282 RepID=UPI00311E82F3
QLNLELMMLDSQEVFDLIRNHEIHFGIIEKPMMDETIETFPLFKDELVLAGDPESDIYFISEAGSGVAHYTHNYL